MKEGCVIYMGYGRYLLGPMYREGGLEANMGSQK